MAYFASIHSTNGLAGRVYIQQIRPRAKKFLDRSASRRFTPRSSVACNVIDVIGTSYTVNAASEPSSSGLRLVAGLAQVPLVEAVAVDDDRGARRKIRQVRLQRRGVHRDQHVGCVARRDDVAVRDVHLERRHTGDGAGRSADLGGVVRQRREVVAEHGGQLGEPVADELHAVAGVAGEADDDAPQLLGLALRCRGGGHGPSPLRRPTKPPWPTASTLPRTRRATSGMPRRRHEQTDDEVPGRGASGFGRS